MSPYLLPLAAPLVLLLTALVAAMRPGRRPAPVPALAEGASLVALVIALLSAGVAIVRGAGESPLLGAAPFGMSARLDAVSTTMLVLVAFVGWVVTRYARTYLDGEERQGAFHGWLATALAAVMLLVVSGNLVQFGAAWVVVSFCVHRLLLFFPERAAARRAARKKAVVALAGGLSLAGGLVLLAWSYGTGDIGAINAAARAGVAPGAVTIAALMLAVAAMLKSAQFPTHGWLTEVMEAPTPVSALLHAGVINAGGFLLIRFADVMLLAPGVLAALAILGGVTALFGALVMLTQPAVKTSLAWSTVGQMGFMMLQCGLALFPLALLHIVAHSLYKAHAFLASGGAVEQVASTRRPGPVAVPSSAAVIRAFGLALLIYGVIGAAFWSVMGEGRSPQALALGAILVFGVAYLLAQGLADAAPAALTRRTAAYSLAAAVGYFALHTAAEWLTHGVVPPAPAPGRLEWTLLVLAVVSFGAVALAQALFPLWAAHPAAGGLRVHLANGLYANAVFDRLLSGWLVPRRGTRAHHGEARPLPAAGEQPSAGQVSAAAGRAGNAIPPTWPLASSVAVNPFLGQTNLSLSQVAPLLRRISGTAITMPRAWYVDRIRSGDISSDDLAAGLAASRHGAKPASVRELTEAAERPAAKPPAIPTVAELAAHATGIDWSGLVAERIGHWAAGYFDAGQALWAAPRGSSAWAAWRDVASRDLTPEINGLTGFAARIAGTPQHAHEAIHRAVERLGLSANALDTYFHQLLASLGGYAQYARYLRWQAELAGGRDDTLTDLLAIRLVWEAALLDRHEAAVAKPWSQAIAAHASPVEPTWDDVIDEILQEAAERAAQRRLAAELATASPRPVAAAPRLQAAFCIDVRSEVFRRALESLDPAITTLGFAGFFGLAVSHRRLASDVPEARCPVLLSPGLGTHAGDGGPESVQLDHDRRIRARAHRAWGRFKLAAVSSFAFVEAAAPLYVPKLLRDALGLARVGPPRDPAPRPDAALDLDTKVRTAETVLRAMSLTSDFGRLVLLVGHGATVVNNPHGSALHCGACGGYSGEVNARLLAALLNDRAVRSVLPQRGITIPADTLFLGALHDTTTDAVTIYDDEPESSHAADVAQARTWLQLAGEVARGERARRLPRAAAADAIARRARDWAEVRPEWALAGCQAFIAAPRQRTSTLNLEGRAFLHEYHWQRDTGFGVLELIMTAPVVVASWISLQYYGSSVAPALFGGGNKVLHNVTGGIGVVEGNGGLLRAGLPLQSVHDGERLVHEPLRLAVIIEAPREAMTAILERHAGVRALFDNRWLHLLAIDEGGRVAWRYAGNLQWESALPAEPAAVPALQYA